MAPEVVRNQPYGEKIDVWAIGVLAYFLSTQGKYPFPGLTQQVVDDKILEHPPALQELNSPEIVSFVKKCLTKEVDLRPSVGDLLGEQGHWPNNNSINQLEANFSDETTEIQALFFNMSKVCKMSRLQVGFTSFISNVLILAENIQLYIKLFEVINKAKNGRISREEFIEAYQHNFVKDYYRSKNMPDIPVNQLFNRIKQIETAMDEDSEYIAQSEFLTAALDLKVQHSQQNLELMFRTLAK